LELVALDQFFLQRPPEPIDNRIVIVAINEADVQQAGQWPMSDAMLAKLLENLKRQKPTAIGLDLYRDLKVNPGHAELVKLFETTPNLIGVEKVAATADSSAVKPPPALKQRNQVGSNDMPPDNDGKMRRGLLYLNTKTGEPVFSFSFLLAAFYLEPRGIKPELTADQQVKLGKAVFPPFEASDGGYVRAEARGYQIIRDFRGGIEQYPTISMTDVLANRIPPDLMRDRIVLIGTTAESLKDLFYTPLSSRLSTTSQPMAGVVIHANLISQILDASLAGRPLIKTWSEPVEALWILLWAIVGSSISWEQRHGNMNKRASWTALTIALAGGGLIVGSYMAFLSGWWIPLVPPMIALGGSAIAVTAYIARTASDIRKTFGRYLTSEVVSSLLESPEGLKLGGERRKITILTSDIRGFTAVSERLPAEEVIHIINLYLGYMADVITEYQGTIDEFMGDGILVLFGAPTARKDDAERAIACAVAMQLAMTQVNEKMAELGLPSLEMGVGINTGEVVVGNIGSEKRSKYGVVGNQVNLTYRIESYTVGGQIFASESTLKEVGSIVKINTEREVLPKGVKQPLTIYDIGGIGGQYNLTLAEAEVELFSLPEALPLQYAVLEGKHVSSTIVQASLVKLSSKIAEIKLDTDQPFPASMTNLKLNLCRFGDQSISEDIYAKVLAQPAAPNCFQIRFTEKPPDVEAKFSEILKSMGTLS
jgi:adenylate cyclase